MKMEKINPNLRKKDATVLLGKHNDDEETVKSDKKLSDGVMVKTSNKIEKDTHKEPVVINNSGWKFPDVSELSDAHKDADPGNMSCVRSRSKAL